MKNLFQFLLFGTLIGAMYSCQQPLYIPNTHNTPVLTKQGDLDINFTTGSNGWDLQAAGAVTNEIGVMLNTSVADRTNDSSRNYNKHSFIELGVGYTALLNKKTYEEGQKQYIFSVFGGAGFGSASGLYEINGITNVNNGKYFRPFIQPAVGMAGDHFDMFFSMRACRAQFSEIVVNGFPVEFTNSNRDNNTYLEPVLTMRMGGPLVKFVWQMGASVGHYPPGTAAFRNRPVIFIIGLNFNKNFAGQ